jgi:hypothetical protein
MRRLAFVVALTTSLQAAAAPTQRSLVSGVGVGLIGLGVAALGVGAGQFLSWNEVEPTVAAYARSPPDDPEKFATRDTLAWSQRAMMSGLVAGIAGLALVAGGVVALVLDRPQEAVSFFVTPTTTGGALGLSGRF